MKIKPQVIIPVATAAVGTAAGLVVRSKADTRKKYLKKVNSLKYFENDLGSALPQTVVFDIIKNHFESELPEGKTRKKLIVIGYDGCRDDVLTEAENSGGAMKYLIESGGKAYFSYCGGVKYPAKNTQPTSTAPGWCSMLTGLWSDVNGVTGNGIVKSNEYLTLLTTLVENNTINGSAFYVSWDGHFSNDDSTYTAEKNYAEEKGLNEEFICADGDDGTLANVMNNLERADCSDFIFPIFEYCDHAGHTEGFFSEKKSYKQAFVDNDRVAMKIIDKIQARESYETEDWLIILTSDHGGHGTSHGRASIQERDTFIFANKALDI